MEQVSSIISQRDIILLNFPFSNLNQSKVRPVIVLSNNRYNKKSNDVIVVPLTSNLKQTDHYTLITTDDLEKGYLVTDSMVKVDRIFSINKQLVRTNIGRINKPTLLKIQDIIVTARASEAIF